MVDGDLYGVFWINGYYRTYDVYTFDEPYETPWSPASNSYGKGAEIDNEAFFEKIFERYLGEDLTADTDGDGIVDYFEKKGMYLPNAGLIKTDYTNPDTDGDGLLDGEEIDTEMIQYNPGMPSDVVSNQRYFFLYSSYPDRVDSDGDGDGYDDVSDESPLIENFYSFLDNEVYSFICMNKEPYPKYKLAQNGLDVLGVVETFGDDFKFSWNGNGYVITHIPTSKKLTIDVNGEVTLKATEIITDNQLWEVIQYEPNNTGIVIKSKVYLFSDSKYYPQYLCYKEGKIASSTSTANANARLMPTYGSKSLPFGYVYMSYLNWIDNGVLASHHSQAVSNYLNNMQYSFSGFINGQKVHKPSMAMKFGGYTDGYNACGWISIYNACLLNSKYVHPKDIIWFLEINNHTILNGYFGCSSTGIKDFFLEHDVPITSLVALNQNIIKNYPAAILMYWHGSGAHYVTLNWDKSLSKYVVYNHYSYDNSVKYYDNLNSGKGAVFWSSKYLLLALYAIG